MQLLIIIYYVSKAGANMTIERFTLISMAIFSITSVFYIPKEKIRLALVAYVAFQTTTWFIFIFLTEINYVASPVREFVKATRAAFIPAFLFNPMIFTLYIILFPKRDNLLLKLSHYLIFVSIIVGVAYFTAIYTDIYKILKGSILSQLINAYLRNIIQFALCHLYIKWLFKK
jgi:hypothetical protein